MALFIHIFPLRLSLITCKWSVRLKIHGSINQEDRSAVATTLVAGIVVVLVVIAGIAGYYAVTAGSKTSTVTSIGTTTATSTSIGTVTSTATSTSIGTVTCNSDLNLHRYSHLNSHLNLCLDRNNDLNLHCDYHYQFNLRTDSDHQRGGFDPHLPAHVRVDIRVHAGAAKRRGQLRQRRQRGRNRARSQLRPSRLERQTRLRPRPSTRAFPAGVVTIPDTISAVVPAYNIPGLSNGLKFTGNVLAEIFLGQITTWNDPAIASAQPRRHSTIQRNHRSAPLRRKRDDVRLHPVPL